MHDVSSNESQKQPQTLLFVTSVVEGAIPYAYLLFVSLETSVTRHFHIANTQMMNDKFRDAVT